MDKGVVFEVNTNEEEEAHQLDDEDVEYTNNLLKYLNLEVAGDDLKAEDTYVEGHPFEKIASNMFNLLGNGKIKKRVLREGYGQKPPDMSVVRVHYNGYIEYQVEPFDSTYARTKPHQFTVNNGEVLVGLDLAVQSMKLNEKSQFIVHPDYAYRKFGCLERVPGDSEVLFEIELIEIIDCGAAATFEQLPEQEQKEFKHVYEYCLALCAKGKDMFGKNINGATKEYNAAVSKLEHCFLADMAEQEKQQELLMRLYTNLLICHAKTDEPKKGCINFNKIMDLVKGTDLKIPAKCYYNNAKCLRMLGDYKLAKRRLEVAYRAEPKNPDILNLLLNLEDDMRKSRREEIERSKAMCGIKEA
ncbi:unnamed protein product [Acanthoscelides obtectus]|nr:unnamed protein product [Acanthoscelides obtectus]CAK1676119.1 Inactive peptidyl-prolyl cis-trans isomerase shutdown [Acanthoscelides obtectus]